MQLVQIDTIKTEKKSRKSPWHVKTINYVSFIVLLKKLTKFLKSLFLNVCFHSFTPSTTLIDDLHMKVCS